MAEYVKREDVLELAKRGFIVGNRNYSSVVAFINGIPSADVVERDEGIRIGAELAAMHGSDATSQDLERAYWDGYEEAMKKRDVRTVVLCRDCIHFQQFRTWDGFCKIDGMLWNNDFFCANGKKEES